jgi:AbiV family abortive infection protein
MVRIDEQRRDTIREARRSVTLNAARMNREAVQLFQQGEYPLACFAAITAIEETGKAVLLRHVEGTEMEELGIEPPEKIHAGEVENFLIDHREKALMAVAQSLNLNANADHRHGRHPESGVHRTSGLILLIKAGEWMGVRNNCLYTEIKLKQNFVESPTETINQNHAYYFIAMAFEVIAEQAESGIGSFLERGSGVKELHEFRNGILSDLSEFMDNWEDEVDIDQLEFLQNPSRLREKADEQRN